MSHSIYGSGFMAAFNNYSFFLANPHGFFNHKMRRSRKPHAVNPSCQRSAARKGAPALKENRRPGLGLKYMLLIFK